MGHIPVAKPSPILREWKFPKRGLAIALVLVLMFALAGVILSTAWPRNVPPVHGPSLLPATHVADLQVGQPVRNDGQRFWLVKEPDGTVIALSTRDPRNGCTVPWRPDFEFAGKKGWFRDPCHGSTYDAYGHKVFGPSPRDMDHYEVTVSGGVVYVNTSHLICSDGSYPCVSALPLPR